MRNPLLNPETQPSIIAEEAARQIRAITKIDKYDIAVTLGSGWGQAANAIGEITHEIYAENIIGFSKPNVDGHTGTIKSIITPEGKHVLVIGAREHYYESHEPYHVRKVVHGVRTAAKLGCATMVLTNGAGSVKPEWKPSTVVTLKDHINLTGGSPLEGATFIDLTDLYTKKLRSIVSNLYPEIPEGVYVQNRGPAYETPAEVIMAKTLGGDIVGMSTALEAIAAREAGMDVLGLSLITNLAAGVTDTPLNHQEVLDTGRTQEAKLATMLSKIINQI